MDQFPAVDPIPLPAPVWLFKVLHILTLTLHFVSMHLLLGGLMLGVLWAIVGRAAKHSAMLNASGLAAFRLPIVMAYVINLGVPPLLFAQVLYGRALYTSSVLMGAFWLSVIFLVIGSYFFLYMMSRRAESGRPWAWPGAVSLALALAIAFIYANNMTLMLRPEGWVEMYRGNPFGAQLNAGDPTVLPRWVFMVLGSLAVAGAGILLLACKSTLEDATARFLRVWGGRAMAVFFLVQLVTAWWVFQAQPEAVRQGVLDRTLLRYSVYAWEATAITAALAGLAASLSRARSWALPAVACAVAFLNVASMVIVRDGIRDVTLLGKGFDVWDRAIATNWQVVTLFLILFVFGLAALGWMAWVVATARAVEERYA